MHQRRIEEEEQEEKKNEERKKTGYDSQRLDLLKEDQSLLERLSDETSQGRVKQKP